MRNVLLLVCLALLACNLTDRPEPKVSAAVEDFVEHDDGYTKIGQVTIKLENESEVPVYSLTIAVSLKTDRNTYYQTVYDDRGIPPKTVIWLTLEFPYFTADESATIDGALIDDLFFE